jgi:hypothetical protein
MTETFRHRSERSYNCATQLISVIQSLEYWKEGRDDETAWLMEKAIEFTNRAMKQIEKDELMKGD